MAPAVAQRGQLSAEIVHDSSEDEDLAGRSESDDTSEAPNHVNNVGVASDSISEAGSSESSSDESQEGSSRVDSNSKKQTGPVSRKRSFRDDKTTVTPSKPKGSRTMLVVLLYDDLTY